MDRSDRGAAVVETAIAIVLFMLLIFGIIEFGRGWFLSNLLNQSVRSAARLAAVKPNLAQNDKAVLQRIDDLLKAGGLSAESRSLTFVPPLQTGGLVRIMADMKFMPIVAPWAGGKVTIPLHAEVVTRYEM